MPIFARRAPAALGLFLLLFALSAWSQVAVPESTRRVTDLTATLSADQVASLENTLATFEAQKGSQIAVLIVSSTQPEDIAQFGIRVAEQWKIGRAKEDDGVILLVAKDDRKLRLEVGYGLEGAIPDAIAKRVIAETITPYFKAGDFYGGIEAGVRQVMRLIEGESLPPPGHAESGLSQADDNLLVIVGLGIFLGIFFSPMMGNGLAGSIAGIGVAGLGWVTSGMLAGSLLLGGLTFLAVLLLAGMRGGWGGGGGWGSGGGGSLGGGGFGGGSWGGGGGGFGGGGASGSW